MADQRLSLLIGFMRQNNNRLAARRRRNAFASLRDEVASIEHIVADAYRPVDPE